MIITPNLKAYYSCDKTADLLSFDGTDDYVYTTTQYTNPQTFSLCGFFNTTTTAGRKIIGFEDQRSGESSYSHDRNVYVDTSGRLIFGVYDGAVKLATSSTSYNDGKWHSFCATFNGTNLILYVDGVSDGTGSASGAQNYSGYWRIGAFKGGGSWTGSSAGYFAGKLYDMRIYSRVLSSSEAEAFHNGNSVSDTDLITWYKMDEGENTTLDDASGNSNDGTIDGASWISRAWDDSHNYNLGTVDGASLTTGKFGQCYSFDGTDDYIDCGNNDTLKVSGDITLCAWVKATLTGDAYQRILAKESGVSGTGGYGLYVHRDGRIYFTTDGSVTDSDSADVTADEWIFIVGVTNGTYTKIYTNGTEIDSYNRQLAKGAGTSDAKLYIGASEAMADRNFNGLIDSPMIFSKALSQSDIKRVMLGLHPLDG
jgi:hypothetical protein